MRWSATREPASSSPTTRTSSTASPPASGCSPTRAWTTSPAPTPSTWRSIPSCRSERPSAARHDEGGPSARLFSTPLRPVGVHPAGRYDARHVSALRAAGFLFAGLSHPARGAGPALRAEAARPGKGGGPRAPLLQESDGAGSGPRISGRHAPHAEPGDPPSPFQPGERADALPRAGDDRARARDGVDGASGHQRAHRVHALLPSRAVPPGGRRGAAVARQGGGAGGEGLLRDGGASSRERLFPRRGFQPGGPLPLRLLPLAAG